MRGARLLPPVRSVAIGNGWSSNTVNTAIFRHHGILTFGRYQFLSHYEDRHTLAVVRRDLASDDLEWGRIAGDYELADAHNVSCLGADPDGHLHISYDHHNSRPKYRRSLHPLSVQAWSEEAAMTGKPEERVTYPTFIMNVGDGADRRLVFAYRSGSHDCGEIRLKRYDHAAAVWSDDAQPILSGLGGPWTAGPYLNHPCVDGDGRLHISFVWRTALLQPGAIVNNRNLSCAVSPDGGRTWLTARGFRLAPPLTPVTAETIFAHPCGANLMNQNGMALDSKGEPHIAFFADDDHGIVQYYHCWRAGSRWNSSVVSARDAAFSLSGNGTLPLPISRPAIVIDRSDAVFLILRGDLTGDRMAALRLLPPDYAAADAQWFHLTDQPLGHAEPVVDRSRWEQDGVLSMLIQHNEAPNRDRPVSRESTAPVVVMDWTLADLRSG